jgi:hypothetical protein
MNIFISEKELEFSSKCFSYGHSLSFSVFDLLFSVDQLTFDIYLKFNSCSDVQREHHKEPGRRQPVDGEGCGAGQQQVQGVPHQALLEQPG